MGPETEKGGFQSGRRAWILRRPFLLPAASCPKTLPYSQTTPPSSPSIMFPTLSLLERQFVLQWIRFYSYFFFSFTQLITAKEKRETLFFPRYSEPCKCSSRLFNTHRTRDLCRKHSLILQMATHTDNRRRMREKTQFNSFGKHRLVIC